MAARSAKQRIARLVALTALAGLLGVAAHRAWVPPHDPSATPRATDPMRPKIFDFPGYNFW